MAKKKITALIETTSYTISDIFPIVVNTTTIPASRKIASENVFKHMISDFNLKTPNGVDFTPGADIDCDLLTVNVTGTPKLMWDESIDSFVYNKPLQLGDILLSGSVNTDNFIVNADCNVIDSLATRNVIGGGGSSAYGPNLIGSQTKPAGGGPVFPVGHNVNDTDYVSGAANIAVIAGGYDHVLNQEAGFIGGGGHNFIKYNSGGHSGIVCGSYNLVTAGRGYVLSGSANGVLGASAGSYSVVVGGNLNSITGVHSVILGGSSNILTGDYSLVFGRNVKHTASGSVTFADQQAIDFTVNVTNRFACRFENGYYFDGGALTVHRNSTLTDVENIILSGAGTSGNAVSLALYACPTDSTSVAKTGRVFGKWDSGSYTGSYMILQTAASGGVWEDTLRLQNMNAGLGQATFGTNAKKVLAIGNGTAPATSPADAFQVYAADQAVGNSCLHTRTENGKIIKLFQGAAIANATTDITSLATQLNLLLAQIRDNGLIST